MERDQRVLKGSWGCCPCLQQCHSQLLLQTPSSVGSAGNNPGSRQSHHPVWALSGAAADVSGAWQGLPCQLLFLTPPPRTPGLPAGTGAFNKAENLSQSARFGFFGGHSPSEHQNCPPAFGAVSFPLRQHCDAASQAARPLPQ